MVTRQLAYTLFRNRTKKRIIHRYLFMFVTAQYLSKQLRTGEREREREREREDWSSASVISHTILSDPTIGQPGFSLPRRTWSPMNRFRADQGPFRANLHEWGLVHSPSCDFGKRQTMNHIVDTCPLTKLEGGLNLLHEADDNAVI